MDKITKLQELINNSKNIVFFGGAGVSTASGLKDFRGKNGLNKLNLDYPLEYMLSCDCFYDNPRLFFDFYKNMNSLNAKPNNVHKYLKKLEDKKNLTIVTQNIDGLHQKAGSKNVLEIHGSILRNYCINCHKFYDAEFVFNSKDIPICDCGNLIKPDVVLYGEMLPDCYIEAIEKIIKSDLLIVAGTSLTVEPASSLIKYHKNKLVIINDTSTKYDSLADLVINKDLNSVFDKLEVK